MCRLAAYLGPPVPLSTLLYDTVRSLEVQSYEPREQLTGKVNVDGTGIAWWAAGEPEPLRYVTERPPWSDANLPALSRRLASGVQLAVVRSATPGLPMGAVSVPPFVHGRLALAHNGALERFREKTFAPLFERLPRTLQALVAAVSDTQLVLLTVVRHLEARPADGLPAALAAAAREIAAVSAEADASLVLNLVVADGERLVACRYARGRPAPALYTLARSRRWPEALLVSSEPLDDDPGWTPLPEDHVAAITAFGVAAQPIDGDS